jgi:hypothetical protein
VIERENNGENIWLQQFAAALSSASIVSEVQVRAWNPETGKEIVESVKLPKNRLGDLLATDATASAKQWGNRVSYTIDRPVSTTDEAKILARARMNELAMNYITAEARCDSDDKLTLVHIQPGRTVRVELGETGGRFNGNYFIAGATHRYMLKSLDPQLAGYVVTARLRRSAEGDSKGAYSKGST